MTRLSHSFPDFDLRPVHPRERRRRLLQRFERLDPGTGFVLVVDEHPLPLIHWLSERRFGEFEGSFLERGFTWRVLIRRR